jgi:DNA-binding HxlR family transcriptional regulator
VPKPKSSHPSRVEFEHGQPFLQTISERWNYLILREVFFGIHRFGELKRQLGISTNILTSRLNTLTELGLLDKKAYRPDKQWFEYELSDRARDLIVPAIVAITRWGDEQLTGDTASRPLLHTTCNQETNPYLVCDQCGQPATAATLKAIPQPTSSES